MQAAEKDSELSGRGTKSTAAPPRLGGIRWQSRAPLRSNVLICELLFQVVLHGENRRQSAY